MAIDTRTVLYDCRFRTTKKGKQVPGCGPGQTVTTNYEPTSARMTGSTNILVSRCGGCGDIISASILDAMRWAEERTR